MQLHYTYLIICPKVADKAFPEVDLKFAFRMLRYCGSLFARSGIQRAASIDTKKMIMRLRQESQLPLGTCRSALQATNWNFEEALVHLEKEAKALGMKKMESLGTSRKAVKC